jgi:hypothetical protein
MAAKLLHSQKLVSALRRLAGIYTSRYQTGQPTEFESQEDALIRDASAENHIIAHTEIWKQYEAFRKLGKKAGNDKKEFNTQLIRKLDAKFKQKLIPSSARVRPKSYVKDNVPALIHTQILRNCQSISFDTKQSKEVWLDGILIAKGKELSSRVKTFIREEIKNSRNIAAVYDILKAEREASEAQVLLQQAVRKLIMRIESGEPLLGNCDACPKVYITARPK